MISLFKINLPQNLTKLESFFANLKKFSIGSEGLHFATYVANAKFSKDSPGNLEKSWRIILQSRWFYGKV